MAEREGFEPSKGKIRTLINILKTIHYEFSVTFFGVFRAKMDDFDDELRLTFEQTEMLRRICEAISYYGGADEWHNNRYDQMLLLSSVVEWIAISNE